MAFDFTGGSTREVTFDAEEIMSSGEEILFDAVQEAIQCAALQAGALGPFGSAKNLTEMDVPQYCFLIVDVSASGQIVDTSIEGLRMQPATSFSPWKDRSGCVDKIDAALGMG